MHFEDSQDEDAFTEQITDLRCPSCGGKLHAIVARKNIPYEGDINILTYLCRNCLYRETQVWSDGESDPEVVKFVIEYPDDLNAVVYRSPTCSIHIPEIDVDVYPASASTGEITTVEGILLEIRDLAESFQQDSEDPDRARNTISTLTEVISGRGDPLTLILKDTTGRSEIHSEKAEVVRADYDKE